MWDFYSHQIFHYTCCITPKRVTSLRGPSPRHCAWAQLLSEKCCSGGKPLATLCSIWPTQDMNLRPLVPETNALPLDQVAGFFNTAIMNISLRGHFYTVFILNINRPRLKFKSRSRNETEQNGKNKPDCIWSRRKKHNNIKHCIFVKKVFVHFATFCYDFSSCLRAKDTVNFRCFALWLLGVFYCIVSKPPIPFSLYILWHFTNL